jgi:hypothetical protein
VDRKLDEQLVEDFPMLYKDRYASMRKTCLCWGFDCGNGWESLVRRASQEIEAVIQQWLDDNPDANCECGCSKFLHEIGQGKCTHVFHISYGKTWRVHTHSRDEWKIPFQKFWWKITRWRDRFLNWLCEKEILYKELPCVCEKYYPCHPKASQVKEKFGGLRLYMTHGNEEIWKIIDRAEIESYKTCEECGKNGELRNDLPWHRTLCYDCYQQSFGV